MNIYKCHIRCQNCEGHSLACDSHFYRLIEEGIFIFFLLSILLRGVYRIECISFTVVLNLFIIGYLPQSCSSSLAVNSAQQSGHISQQQVWPLDVSYRERDVSVTRGKTLSRSSVLREAMETLLDSEPLILPYRIIKKELF